MHKIKQNKSPYRLKEKQYKFIIVEVIDTALDTLTACLALAEKWHRSNGFKTTLMRQCFGLYTFALEEYGKLLWLKSLKVKDGMVTIPKAIFSNHDKKFELALKSKDLPNSCKRVYTTFFKSTSRGYQSKHTVPNIESRVSIFYADMDSKGYPVRYPRINQSMLEKAINQLWNTLLVQREAL